MKKQKEMTPYEKTKVFLLRYRTLIARIEHVRLAIIREEERAKEMYNLYPSSAIDEGKGCRTGINKDAIPNTVIRIHDKIRKGIEDKEYELQLLEYEKEQADEILKAVPWDYDERTVIEMSFLSLDYKTNWQIAQMLKPMVSERTVNNIKRRGIERLADCDDIIYI